MSIKVNIKDIEINEIFEFDKIDTKVEKVKQSNTFVISTKKIYYFDDDDTFKLVPQLDYNIKNKVLTEYLGLPTKNEGVNYNNKGKHDKYFKNKEGHVSINISSLNVQNFKYISRVISGLNRMKRQNYDFICFQKVLNFTNEYRIILRELNMNYIYDNKSQLLIGNFEKYGTPDSQNRKWKEINTYHYNYLVDPLSLNELSIIKEIPLIKKSKYHLPVNKLIPYQKLHDEKFEKKKLINTSGTLFKLSNNENHTIFILNCYFSFYNKFSLLNLEYEHNNNFLEKEFDKIITYYKTQLINNNNILFEDKDFNFIICGNFNNLQYKLVINKVLKKHNIKAKNSCELVDNPKCSDDTLKKKKFYNRSTKYELKLTKKFNLDGFFVSDLIHVSDSQVRTDLCHNWSDYNLIELKCYLTDLEHSKIYNSLYSLLNDVEYSNVYHHNLKRYNDKQLNINNFQKNKFNEMIGYDKDIFKYTFYLDDSEINSLDTFDVILDKTKSISSLSELSKFSYILTSDINNLYFNNYMIPINYFLLKHLFINYGLLNFNYNLKSFYIYLDRNKNANLSIFIRSTTNNLFLLENEIKIIYNDVIELLFNECIQKKNKKIIHLISYIFKKIIINNVMIDKYNFSEFDLLKIISDCYLDHYVTNKETNNSEFLDNYKENALKLYKKISLNNKKKLTKLLKKSNDYFKKHKSVKYIKNKNIKEFFETEDKLIIKINYNLVTQDLNCFNIVLNPNKNYIQKIIKDIENKEQMNGINTDDTNIELYKVDFVEDTTDKDDIDKIDNNSIFILINNMLKNINL